MILGTAQCFFCHILTQVNDFVTSSLFPWVLKSFQNGMHSYRKEFALNEANSFLCQLNPFVMGGKRRKYKICFSASVPVHLKAQL